MSRAFDVGPEVFKGIEELLAVFASVLATKHGKMDPGNVFRQLRQIFETRPAATAIEAVTMGNGEASGEEGLSLPSMRLQSCGIAKDLEANGAN